MSWHEIAKAAVDGQDSFFRYFPQLPKKIRTLIKHMDDRYPTAMNIEHQLQHSTKTDRQLLRALVAVYQTFPPNTRFPTQKHNNKYAQFSKISTEDETTLLY